MPPVTPLEYHGLSRACGHQEEAGEPIDADSASSCKTLAGPYAGSAKSGGSFYAEKWRNKTGWTPVNSVKNDANEHTVQARIGRNPSRVQQGRQGSLQRTEGAVQLIPEDDFQGLQQRLHDMLDMPPKESNEEQVVNPKNDDNRSVLRRDHAKIQTKASTSRSGSDTTPFNSADCAAAAGYGRVPTVMRVPSQFTTPGLTKTRQRDRPRSCSRSGVSRVADPSESHARASNAPDLRVPHLSSSRSTSSKHRRQRSKSVDHRPSRARAHVSDGDDISALQPFAPVPLLVANARAHVELEREYQHAMSRDSNGKRPTTSVITVPCTASSHRAGVTTSSMKISSESRSNSRETHTRILSERSDTRLTPDVELKAPPAATPGSINHHKSTSVRSGSSTASSLLRRAIDFFAKADQEVPGSIHIVHTRAGSSTMNDAHPATSYTSPIVLPTPPDSIRRHYMSSNVEVREDYQRRSPHETSSRACNSSSSASIANSNGESNQKIAKRDSDSQRTLVDSSLKRSRTLSSFTAYSPSLGSERRLDVEKVLNWMKGNTNLFTGRSFSNKYRSLYKERTKLPVFQYLNEFYKMFMRQSITLVAGATGSGKSTQIPQLIAYAEGLQEKDSRIVCTQPRRIAATSLAERVAKELDVVLGEEVGYRIRFDDATDTRTFLSFTTDAQLLQECVSDPYFTRYSVVIVDEAHERSIAIDLLLSMLKQAVMHRKDLKAVIMSATMDEEKFQRYFASCDVSTRRKLYPLLKVPGKLHEVEVIYHMANTPKAIAMRDIVQEAVSKVLHIHQHEPPGDILVFLTGADEIEDACRLISESRQEHSEHCGGLVCLPLYASLPAAEQQRINEHLPNSQSGKPVRKVIVSTNIAEASITVNGIAYVVDSGRAKKMIYNHETRVSTLAPSWISQAAANQRKGRAGRTRPGKCYRLYSEKDFEKMDKQEKPEMLKVCLEEVVLKMVAINVKDVNQFDYIDRPTSAALEEAVETLQHLGALNGECALTDIGHQMVKLPSEPRLSRTLIASEELGCSGEILTIVAMLSAKLVFLRPRKYHLEADTAKHRFNSRMGDHITLLNVYNEYLNNYENAENWCKTNYLSYVALREAELVRKQIQSMMDSIGISCIASNTQELEATGYANVRRALVCGFFMQTAKAKPYFSYGDAYSTVMTDQIAYVHPSSALRYRSPTTPWILYHEVTKTTQTFLKTVTPIDPEWLQPYLKDKKSRVPEGSAKNLLIRLGVLKAASI